jgi:hypothetical protein
MRLRDVVRLRRRDVQRSQPCAPEVLAEVGDRLGEGVNVSHGLTRFWGQLAQAPSARRIGARDQRVHDDRGLGAIWADARHRRDRHQQVCVTAVVDISELYPFDFSGYQFIAVGVRFPRHDFT